MDSRTIGIPLDDPEGYKLTVENAVRITNGGVYVHSAPWSTGSQGYANVSHGCINLGPDNAAWYFDMVSVGDPVIVRELTTLHGLACRFFAVGEVGDRCRIGIRAQHAVGGAGAGDGEPVVLVLVVVLSVIAPDRPVEAAFSACSRCGSGSDSTHNRSRRAAMNTRIGDAHAESRECQQRDRDGEWKHP